MLTVGPWGAPLPREARWGWSVLWTVCVVGGSRLGRWLFGFEWEVGVGEGFRVVAWDLVSRRRARAGRCGEELQVS